MHGAWSGGWCYARVAALLRARGHTVFTPTLTGQGERAHLMSGAINLSTHIEDILGVFHYERLNDAVLAGHSYGGMVITGVADRIADKIKALAYLDAFVPQNGQSLFDINIPANTQRFLDNAGASGGLSVPAPPAAYFGVNAADAPIVDALATPFPLGCFTEKLKLTGRLSRGEESISTCTARCCRAQARSGRSTSARSRRAGARTRSRAGIT